MKEQDFPNTEPDASPALWDNIINIPHSCVWLCLG